MLFHGDIARQIAAALTAQMADPDPTIRRLALQALVTIRGDRSAGAGPCGRAAAGRSRRLGPHLGGHHDQGVPPEGRAAASPIPRRWRWSTSCWPSPGPTPRRPRCGFSAASDRCPASSRSPIPRRRSVRDFAAENADRPRRGAGGACGHSPPSGPSGPSARRSKRGLGDADPQARVAAIRLALEPKAKIAESALRKALDDPAPARSDRPAGADRLRSRAAEAICA